MMGEVDIQRIAKANAILTAVVSGAAPTSEEGLPFPQAIKQARQLMGLTLQEVADATGTAKSYVWDLENKQSKYPSAGLVYRFAKALALDVEELCRVISRDEGRAS